jgi:hypothetical protein
MVPMDAGTLATWVQVPAGVSRSSNCSTAGRGLRRRGEPDATWRPPVTERQAARSHCRQVVHRIAPRPVKSGKTIWRVQNAILVQIDYTGLEEHTIKKLGV